MTLGSLTRLPSLFTPQRQDVLSYRLRPPWVLYEEWKGGNNMDTDSLISEKRQELWDCIADAQAIVKEEMQIITDYANTIQEKSRIDRAETQKELGELMVSKERAEEGERQAQKIAADATIVLNNYKEQLTTAFAETNILRNQLETERTNSERTIWDDLDKERVVLATQREAMEEQKKLQDEIVKLKEELSTERQCTKED